MSRTLLLLSKVILVVACCSGLVRQASAQTVVTLSTSGNTWVVPAGVTSATVYVWGGGGAGGGATGSSTNWTNGGGGGGGACASATFAVTAGQTYTATTIGAGGSGGTGVGGNGGTTTFTGPAGTWTAGGGTGGAAAVIAASGTAAGGAGSAVGTGTGVTVRSGGSGSAGNNSGITGTGGGAGGSTGNGTTPASACGVTGTGGSGTYPGGNGGYTSACGTTTNSTGAAGAVPGGGGGGDNDWTGSQIGGNGGAGQVKIEFTGPPANDACTSPLAIASLPYSSAVLNNALATDDNVGAGCLGGPYKNLWWTVTGICGTMTASTCNSGSNFDSEIHIYTGSCGSLTEITCNDDATCAFTLNSSTVTWTATAGTVYYISAGSYASTSVTGNLQLDVTSSPFTSSVAPTSVTGTTTISSGASTSLTATGGTLGAGAVVQWYTGSCGGTLAFTGNPYSASPAATTTYYVRYSGTCNTTTCATVTVTVIPANDACTSPISIASLPYSSPTLSNAAATDDNVGAGCGGGPYKNLWWTVTGICGTMTASTCNANSNFDAEIHIFTGSCGSLTEVTCNDDATCAFTVNSSTITWTSTAGTLYYVSAGSYSSSSGTGNLQLDVTSTPATSSVAPTSITGTNNICTGGSTTLTASGGSLGTGAVVEWFAGSCASTVVFTGNPYSPAPGSTTTYFARYSGQCNTTTCASVTVTVQPTFNAGSVGSGDQSFCSSGLPSAMSVTGSTGSGSFSYQWYMLNGITTCPSGSSLGSFVSLGSANGASTATYTPTAAISTSTTYACFVTPGGSPTCGTAQWASSCRKVTVNPAATASAGGPYATCGTTAVAINATANGSGTWSGGAGTFASATSTNTTYTPTTGEVGGSVSLTWTTDDPDGAGPCGTAANSATLTVNTPPVVSCGTYGPVCTDAADITLGGSPSGGTWSGTGVTGNSFDPSVGTQTLTYSYTDGNSCTNFCTTTITVNSLPVVTCGSYGPVCTDAADITLGGSPVGGTWSGTGVTGNSFDPSVGTQTVTYSYTDANGCSASCSTTITVNPLPMVTCGSYGPVCTDAADITLGGSPVGGTWSGTGVTGNSFDPSMGTQTVTYGYMDANGCSASCSTTITVNPLPVVTCGSYGPVCADAADITLGGSPTGGTWSGSGVNGNSFDPSAGTQTVTYSYTDGNGCSASCSTTIIVNPLPVLTCGSYGPVCADAADITLGGSPTGGTWSGTGVNGNSFDPSAGTQTVTYSYTDGNGCSASCSTTIIVNELPVVTCGSYGPVCADAADITLGGSPTGGAWSGTGVTGDSFDPSAGTQTVTYNYTDGNGCSAICSTTITVNPLPVVTCGSYGPVCADAADITLSGSPSGGTWSGTGVTGDSFDPSAGTQTVTYSYADGNGCSASCSTTITVNPLPVVSCGSPYAQQCDNGAPLALNGSPSGGTWSGNAVDGDTFDPSLAGAGSWPLTYTYTDGNGCINSCGTTIIVNGASVWYVDADGDGHGDIDDPGVLACDQPFGTVSSNDDECDNDPLKVETGTCGCGVADTDTDSDTYADCIDGCPTDPLKQNPGTCGCGVVDTDSDGDTYADCVDGCPSDPSKIAPGVCGCGSPDIDSDSDGTLNCNDGCPNDPNKFAAGTCGCGNPEPGASCNDGNANTINDTVTAGCVCAGTPTTPIYSLDITTDANGTQTSWDIMPLGGGTALCSGSGYPSGTTSTAFCPLPDAGCYVLTVYDALADGMCCVSGNGGYVLRAPGGARIIDAANNGIFTSSASVALGFCTPIGTDRLTDSRCDRVDYLPNDFVQAIPNTAVQAQYGTGNQTDDGYQFWFFNPNGGYSRRVLVTHANSSTIFPVGPDRCSYIRISSITTSPLPLNVLLNVRVRRQVNGVFAEFGPACRFKIDTETNCPTTQLVATAGSTFSCGISGVMLNGSRTLHAVPVSGANRYQFEFSKPGYLRKLTTTTSSLVLTQWNTLPLQYNSTYNVRVRISYDAGVTFCPFGAICTIATASNGSGMALAGDRDGASGPEERILTMWPNPNSEGRVRFSMTGLGEGAHRVSVDLFDLLGARVQSEQLNINGEELNTIVELIPGIQRGVYLVNVTVDDRLFTERLVVQ